MSIQSLKRFFRVKSLRSIFEWSWTQFFWVLFLYIIWNMYWIDSKNPWLVIYLKLCSFSKPCLVKFFWAIFLKILLISVLFFTICQSVINFEHLGESGLAGWAFAHPIICFTKDWSTLFWLPALLFIMVILVVEFHAGGTKSEWFLPKNQHTQRKLLLPL